jgi:hypothetical protein
MVIFEYDKEKDENLEFIIDNYSLVNSGEFDVLIMASSRREFKYANGIHIWISSADTNNANLLILLSFIITGHPDWKKADIKIFDVCKPEDEKAVRKDMEELVTTGRLPITAANIEVIPQQTDVSAKSLINLKSYDAALTMIGFRKETLKHAGVDLFKGFDNLGTVLFVNAHKMRSIE